jgi:hypothetical protein
MRRHFVRDKMYQEPFSVTRATQPSSRSHDRRVIYLRLRCTARAAHGLAPLRSSTRSHWSSSYRVVTAVRSSRSGGALFQRVNDQAPDFQQSGFARLSAPANGYVSRPSGDASRDPISD